MSYPFVSAPESAAPLGLVVLKSDETIESDFRHMLPADQPVYVSRVPSAEEVSAGSLLAMERHLTAAASLFPAPAQFRAVGYGCTSAASQIGAPRVAELIGAGTCTARVTDPLSALIAACRALGITRLALLSPYVAEVSGGLRAALRAAGIDTPFFGSFDEAEEAKVVRIAPQSIIAAADDLARQGGADAIFLSCTNLRTLGVIEQIEAQTGLTCLSSNQCLAWDMAGKIARVPGKLNGVVAKS